MMTATTSCVAIHTHIDKFGAPFFLCQGIWVTYQPERCAIGRLFNLSVISVPDSSVPSYAMPLVGFRSLKAAQVCAYLAVKSSGVIEKLKLIKLVYLTERAFLRENHLPMLFDELYSLPHGPICSSTLNGIDNIIDEDIWARYIQRHGNLATAVKAFDREELDELSDAEVHTLDKIWEEFGRKTASQLRNWSHENCPEYTEVSRGRVPISYADILRAFDDDSADVVDKEIRDLRIAESVLS